MSNRFSRLLSLWRSRSQGLDELAALETLDGTVAWCRRAPLLGFNTSALRFRVIHALASRFAATEFIETGTYHGATAICARNALRVPVRSCEASLKNCLAAKLITCGLSNIQISHAQSTDWLPQQVERQMQLKRARPFFYLDAHPAGDAEHWPVREELALILKLDSFLLAIDDFSVPELQNHGRDQWAGPLTPRTVREGLVAAGIREIYIPSYPAEFETGHARTGFAIAFRSPELTKALQTEQFPLNLLKAYSLTGAS